jgi:sugar/nucleoside kinase (ribokinase family)
VSILVVGDVMVDVVAVLPGELAHGSDTPAAIEHHFGGSGANVAAWLGEQGLLAARIGADPLGEAAVAGLRGPIERDEQRATGTCVVLVHPGGERTMIPDAGANDAVELRELPEAQHAHFTGYGLLRPGSRAAVRRAIALASDRGMTISVDPSSAAPLAAAPEFLEWVAGASLLLPNADEARVLTGEEDPERAARVLATGREVAVTLGRGGALWTDGDRVVRAPAEDVDAVDTTGAGDAFNGALAAALAGGAGLADAVRTAISAAADSVTRPGARG